MFAQATPTPQGVQRGGLGTQPSGAKPPRETTLCGIDVVCNSKGWDDKSAYQAAELVKAKGFCVVDATVLDEVDLSGMEGFSPPPQQAGVRVAEGLLGRDGSRLTRVYVPEQEDNADSGVLVFEGLREKGDFVKEVARRMWANSNTIDEEAACSCCLLHKAARPGLTALRAKPQKLTQQVALEWAEISVRAQLLVALFLGPGRGTLELGLFDEQASGQVKVETKHGILVLIQPDLLSRNHRAETSAPAFAISCFVLSGSPEPLSPHGREEALRKAVRTLPHAKALRKVALGEEDLPRRFADSNLPPLVVKSAASILPSDTNEEADDDVLAKIALWAGMDFVVDVPMLRFDYMEYMQEDVPLFDDDLSGDTCSERQRMYTKHGSFVDDSLFYPEIFSMSPKEAHNVLPSVRKGMEVAMKATERAGPDFSCMQNKPPRCANLLYATEKEDGYKMEREIKRMQEGPGKEPTFTNTAEDPIRIAFALRLRGKTTLVHTDTSSSLAALSEAQACHWHAPHQLFELDQGGTQFSLVVGSTWNLTPESYALSCELGYLSRAGRCFSFNRDSDGYVMAEGCAAIVLTMKAAWADSSGLTELGELRSVATSHGGSSGLAQPVSSAMEASMDGAMLRGKLAPSDIGIVECHAHGKALADQAEVSGIAKVLPLFLDNEAVMMSASSKTNYGNARAAGGLIALVRVLVQAREAVVRPGLHLKALNPRSENMDQQNFCFVTESCRESRGSSQRWVCINSFGFGGTYASAVVRAKLLDSVTEGVDQVRREVHFWPGGGGKLEPSALPMDGYYIVGSFNEFSGSQPMVERELGVWEALIVLGDNQWESFQIHLDGDPNQALHPGPVQIGDGWSPVHGPDERRHCHDLMWRVGRSHSARHGNNVDTEGAADSTRRSNEVDAEGPADAADPGLPGDQYQVRLCIAGKFRMVRWWRLGPPEVGDGVVAVPRSRYYVRANWNQWALMPMTEDTVKGLWSYTADLKGEAKLGGFVFYIVRNKDPHAAFYPQKDDADDPSVEVCGPEPNPFQHCWMLRSSCGCTVTIRFQRTLGMGDHRVVSWFFSAQRGGAAEGTTEDHAKDGRA